MKENDRHEELAREGRERAIETGLTGEIPCLPVYDSGEGAPVLLGAEAIAYTYGLGTQSCAWCRAGQAGPGLPIEHAETCPAHPEYDDDLHNALMLEGAGV